MKIEYRVENRKVLVQAVNEFSGESAVYMRVPTYAYKVGDFAIDKEGSLLFDESEAMGLIIAMPLGEVNVENLTSLLKARGALIRKALGITAASIEVEEDKVVFPWFKADCAPEKTQAYTHFIASLCQMSLKQKRVTAKTKIVSNERYAFRCVLLRLGFIGKEYRAERKILLANLSGNSAFKSGQRKVKQDAIPIKQQLRK